MKFRTGYDKVKLQYKSDLPSVTKQSFKNESEISNIMRRYEKTGIIDHVSRYNGRYGDFTNAPDYQTAMNKVIQANDMFMTLPARIRKQFDNDPSKFLEFVADPKNVDEVVKMGLAKPIHETSDIVEPSTAQPATTAGAGAVGGSTTQSPS